VVVEAGTRAAAGPARTRPVLIWTAVAAVLVVVLVSVAGLLVSRRIAENQAVHDVAALTDTLAENVVSPILTDAVATDPRAAGAVLDPVVRGHLLTGSLVRVKLWSPTGTILYSDEPRLVGRTFVLDDDARDVLTDPRTAADVTDLQRPENAFERNQGKLLEVYRPVWTPSGHALLFETYFRYDTVTTRSTQIWRGFAGIMLSCLAAVVLLLLPLVWTFVTAGRRARDERDRLTRRALDASDEERRHIAASLHDGVVQQLAAVSFASAGYADRATALGDVELAAGLDDVTATVRDGIAGLRSLLVEIYPPTLHEAGLAAALRDLARSASSADAAVVASLDDAAAHALPFASQESAYRVAQEAVRNAVRHAHAAHVTIRLGPADHGVELEIADDGVGFDAERVLAIGVAGHFGLRLMADAARSCGGGLSVASRPGAGTRVRLVVPS
jgi:signal transduction histidine kinase